MYIFTIRISRKKNVFGALFTKEAYTYKNLRKLLRRIT